MNNIEPHTLKEISHFFTVYKDLQNKKVEVGDWQDINKAKEYIKKSFELYDAKYKK